MKILVIGGGGREHALAWKLAQSPRVTEVLVAPGNAGTAAEPGVRNVPVKADDLDGLLELAQQRGVDLTIVGPEAPLVAGMVDRFAAAGLRLLRPDRARRAAWRARRPSPRNFLARHRHSDRGITTLYRSRDRHWITCANAAYRLSIKADGLAAGKGVDRRPDQIDEAEAAVRDDAR